MRSFAFAIRGVLDTVRTERNMRIHLCFAVYVIIAGFVTQISSLEWIAVLICIGLVMALELLNTAIESLCDTVCPERSKGIRKAKDASAGAVLCTAVFAAAAGGLIFFRTDKIALAINFLKNHTVFALVIIFTLIPLSLFVRGRKREHK